MRNRQIMRPDTIRKILDYCHGAFFAINASVISQIVETTQEALESSQHFMGENDSLFRALSEAGLRRDGMTAILRWMTGMRVVISRLLSELEKKNSALARLEQTLAEQENQIRTLRLSQKQLARDNDAHQALAAQSVARATECHSVLQALVEALSSESWQPVSSHGLSESIQDMVATLNTCLTSHHEHVEEAMRQRQQTIQQLTAALNQIARGEIPQVVFNSATPLSETKDCVHAVATTLHEIYAGISSTADTIRLSMELLFAIAEDIADGAAYQMTALQEFQDAVRQMSQNTLHMAEQTSETAQIAHAMYTLASTLMDEAGTMIAAVSESHEKVESITEIVDQSSLLALNARILAAQAGDHGRGFAVVAEAMKELSDRTDTFLQLIGAHTTAITESTDNVYAGVRKIAASMERAQTYTDQIASGASEHSISTQQMAASVEQILARARHSAMLARKLSEVAKRISIALQQLTGITQFFDPKQVGEFDIYRSVNLAEKAAPIRNIASLHDLREKQLAAIFTNRGPADQIGEYRMSAEAERQRLKLTIYSGENNAQTSFRIAERLLADGKIAILFFQAANNSMFQKVLHLAEQSRVTVIPFNQGTNVSKERVPTQVLIQHYEQGRIAASLVPEKSKVYAILGPANIHCANARAQGFFGNLPAPCACVGQAHGDWTAREATILMRSFFHENGQNACNVIYGINDTTALGAIGASLEYALSELLRQHPLTWSEKIVIGTDATAEMLHCLRGREGKSVLKHLLEPIIRATAQDERIELAEHQEGWTLRWGQGHTATFGIHAGQIWVETRSQTIMLIKEMMTVSYGTVYDEKCKQIGIEAMAVRHLVDCVMRPGKPPYVLFSKEQPITSTTPNEIVSAVQCALTEEQINWRKTHVLVIGPHDELIPVGKLAKS